MADSIPFTYFKNLPTQHQNAIEKEIDSFEIESSSSHVNLKSILSFVLALLETNIFNPIIHN